MKKLCQTQREDTMMKMSWEFVAIRADAGVCVS